MSNDEIKKETNRLLEQYRQLEKGSDEANGFEAIIIELNLGLIRKVVNRFHKNVMEQEDLMQVGMMALLKVIRRYNSDNGVFSVYAYHSVKGAIMNDLKKNKTAGLSGGVDAHELFAQLKKIKREAETQLGRELTLNEWTNRTGMSQDKLIELQFLDCAVMRYDNNERFGVDPSKNVQEEATKNVDVARLRDLFDEIVPSLPLRQEIVLRLKEGLYQNEDQIQYAKFICEPAGVEITPGQQMEFSEIGKVLRISAKQASDIFEKAKEALRHPYITPLLERYL